MMDKSAAFVYGQAPALNGAAEKTHGAVLMAVCG